MKKLLNLRPILFIAISVSCGIATTYFFMRDKAVWGILFAGLFALGLSLFLFLFSRGSRFKPNLIFACVFLLFYLIGGVNVYARLKTYDVANLNGGYFSVTARVDEVGTTDVGTKLILSDVVIDGKLSGKLKYKISLYVYGKNYIGIGDEVEFSTYLYDKDYVYEDKFNASDVERGVKYSASVGVNEITVTGNSVNVLERINLFMRDTLKQGLDDDGFSVCYAMLTGNSSFMDSDLLNAYRTAGVAHVFAVSGLHIGFLATVLTFIFKKIRINSYLKTIIITLVLFFYSGVCGFTASSLRATVMTSVALFARANGKRYDGLSSVALSALIILLFSPVQLLCVGFQLSFAVVIGIILLSRPIAKILKFLPKKIADSLGVVLSAQIFSAPVSLMHFGKFSYIAIAVNLIFVPIVSVLFTVTLVAVLIGGIFGIAKITLFPLIYVFRLVNMSIAVFDHEFFMFGCAVAGGAVIAYFAAAILLSGIVRINNVGKIITTLVLSLICLSNVLITESSDKSAVKIYVSGSEKICATFINDPAENMLIVSDAEHIFSVSGLARIANNSGDKVIDSLVFMGGYSVDMQVFLTKLYSVFEVRSVYYYGERDKDMEDVIKHAFKEVTLMEFFDGVTFPSKVFKLQFGLKGNVITGTAGGKKIAVFSSFKETEPELNKFGGEYDIMIACDRADGLISLFAPARGISYKYSSLYENAQSGGNVLIKLN